jgi:hypothetical protein
MPATFLPTPRPNQSSSFFATTEPLVDFALELLGGLLAPLGTSPTTLGVDPKVVGAPSSLFGLPLRSGHDNTLDQANAIRHHPGRPLNGRGGVSVAYPAQHDGQALDLLDQRQDGARFSSASGTYLARANP